MRDTITQPYSFHRTTWRESKVRKYFQCGKCGQGRLAEATHLASPDCETLPNQIANCKSTNLGLETITLGLVLVIYSHTLSHFLSCGKPALIVTHAAKTGLNFGHRSFYQLTSLQWYYMVLHGIEWYWMVLHGIEWCCIVLHYLAWYCMILHCSALYQTWNLSKNLHCWIFADPPSLTINLIAKYPLFFTPSLIKKKQCFYSSADHIGLTIPLRARFSWSFYAYKKQVFFCPKTLF